MMASLLNEENRWKVAAAVAAGAVVGGSVWWYTRKETEASTSTNVTEKSDAAKVAGEATPEKDDYSLGFASPTADTSREELVTQALDAKNKGNEAYKKKNYKQAVEFYSKAIDLSPENNNVSTFYCNRAACNLHLENFNAVVDDCSNALRINPEYIKALHRRAQAYENLGQKRDALLDYTTICMLEKFQNAAATQAAERVLKELGSEQAKEIIAKKKPSLPSNHLIRSFLQGFSSLEEPISDTEESLCEQIRNDPENATLFHLRAKVHMQNDKFREASEDSFKAAEIVKKTTDISDTIKSKIYAMAALFHHLRGELPQAIACYDDAIHSNDADAILFVKRASTHMESGDVNKCMEDYKIAVNLAPKSSDVFFHRGQVYFVMNDMQKALDDFKRSVDLQPTTFTPYVQYAMALLRTGQQVESQKIFQEAMDKFPNESSVHQFYGQLLMSQQQGQRAIESFEKAIELEPTNPIPLVNLGILFAQTGKQGGLELLQKAIDLDPLCDLAYERLAQLYLSQGQMDDAIANFDKVIELSRNPDDISTACACREAARAQKQAHDRNPQIKERLMQHLRSP